MSVEVHVVGGPAPLTLAELAQLAERPLREIGARKAVVFGSYARGSADAFSDLDLAVVLPEAVPLPERARLLAPLTEALPVAVDVLVYTPEQFARGEARGYGIFDAIAREGVTIYERRAG